MMFDWFKNFRAAKKVVVKAHSGASRYKLVSFPDDRNRERNAPETESEDAILDPYSRGRMINAARQSARNSGIMASLLRTMVLNVVGESGGKLILPFEAPEILRHFARWTRSCDFFDSSVSFREVLALAEITRLLNGDLVALHSSLIDDSTNRLVLFEADEIGDPGEDAIRYHYGPGYRCSQGRVYDPYARFCGLVVSRSQRGKDIFDPSACYFLHADPDASPLDNDWFYISSRWRPNQGRGVSPFAATLASIEDAEMLKNFELQSSKRNSQLLLQVLQEPQKEEEIALPSTFGDADIENMTEDEIKALVAKEIQPQTVSLEKLNQAQAQIQVFEPGLKAELLDTKRPNPNVQAFLDYLMRGAYLPLGLPASYSNGLVTGADYKAQALVAERAFREQQKSLEQFCDWCFRRWHAWSVAHGVIDPLTDDQLESISWEWPSQLEIDPDAKANAERLQLENLTTSFREILGNNYQSKLREIAEEARWMRENGLVHPAYKLLSGGESTLLKETKES